MIIANKHIPPEALHSLREREEVMLFDSDKITYSEISGHPDIFFCEGNGKLVVALNTPAEYLSLLSRKNIHFSLGTSPVGKKHPDSARYNAVITNRFLIHNLKITDQAVLKTYGDLEAIHVSQGYSRCSLLALKDDRFITSDKGIAKALETKGLDVLLVNPKGILLPGYQNGFFGGTVGIDDNKVHFIGSLKLFGEGEKVKSFLLKGGYKIIELYKGPLFDGGSILFVSSPLPC